MTFCFTDKPSAPRDLDVSEVGADFVTLKWSAPKSDGGKAITAYSIEKRDMTRMIWVHVTDVKSGSREYTIKKLLEGRNYQFRISATNEEGEGPFAQSDIVSCEKPPGMYNTQQILRQP